jgi:hypothetical protein
MVHQKSVAPGWFDAVWVWGENTVSYPNGLYAKPDPVITKKIVHPHRHNSTADLRRYAGLHPGFEMPTELHLAHPRLHYYETRSITECKQEQMDLKNSTNKNHEHIDCNPDTYDKVHDYTLYCPGRDMAQTTLGQFPFLGQQVDSSTSSHLVSAKATSSNA